MQWKKKTYQKVNQDMANGQYQLFLQLAPVQSMTWDLLKHEIKSIESSAKVQVIKRSLMKKQHTEAVTHKTVLNSHGTTALVTCESLNTFKRIVKNLFFQNNSLNQFQNKPLVLIHGKMLDVDVNFYDLQRLSLLEPQQSKTLQLFKKPSTVFCTKLQTKNLFFLKLLKASNEN